MFRITDLIKCPNIIMIQISVISHDKLNMNTHVWFRVSITSLKWDILIPQDKHIISRTVCWFRLILIWMRKYQIGSSYILRVIIFVSLYNKKKRQNPKTPEIIKFSVNYATNIDFVTHCIITCYFKIVAFFLTASINLDYKLNWDLFRLNELDCFNAMLTRLYKQELQNIVMRYESYRYSTLWGTKLWE